MSAGDYCSLQDVLRVLSGNSQSRLTTDPTRPWTLGVAPASAPKDWPTPFTDVTSMTGYFGMAPQAGTTLSMNADGTFTISFTSAPASGVVVRASADQDAVNTAIVGQAITDCSREIDSYIGGRYKTPLVDAVQLAMVKNKCLTLVKWTLRLRRDLDEWNPIVTQYNALIRWLEGVAKGQIPLAPTAQENDGSLPATPLQGSEGTVFDAPATGSEPANILLWP